MTRLHSLPDMVQSLLLFVNLTILIIDIYCAVSGYIFSSKKVYSFLNGSLILVTSVLFCLLGLDYYNRHLPFYHPDFLKEIFNKPVAVIMIFLLLLGGLSLASLLAINN